MILPNLKDGLRRQSSCQKRVICRAIINSMIRISRVFTASSQSSVTALLRCISTVWIFPIKWEDGKTDGENRCVKAPTLPSPAVWSGNPKSNYERNTYYERFHWEKTYCLGYLRRVCEEVERSFDGECEIVELESSKSATHTCRVYHFCQLHSHVWNAVDMFLSYCASYW